MDNQLKEWLELDAHRQIAHVWTRYIWRIHGKPSRELDYNARGQYEFRNAQQRLKTARSFNKRIAGFGLRYISEDIAAAAQSLYSSGRSRSNFRINVGGQAKGSKGQFRGQINLTLGYMWLRRVKPLYAAKFENKDWLILDAQPLKVNAKHIKLYECVGYNPRLNENKSVYVAEKTTGKHKFAFGHSLRSVLDEIEEAVRKEVHKAMIGESNEQQSR